jgi:hypothetical protein
MEIPTTLREFTDRFPDGGTCWKPRTTDACLIQPDRRTRVN